MSCIIVARALVSPKGVTPYSKKPYFILNVAFHMSSSGFKFNDTALEINF